MYADYISNGWPLVFTQSHIWMCRERIALGILQNCAVTTKASETVVDELWKMRDKIIFAVKMYRPELEDFLDRGVLPQEYSHGIYLTKPSNREYGKQACKMDTKRANLVMQSRIGDERERLLSLKGEEKRAWQADKEARRLAREARMLDDRKRIKEVSVYQRDHFKRELTAEELTQFIETMQQRLYLGALENAVTDGEKIGLAVLHKGEAATCAPSTCEQESKQTSISFKERSYLKLEKVSHKLLEVTDRLERHRQKFIVNRLLPEAGRIQDSTFDVENLVGKQARYEFIEKLMHIPQQRRAEIISQYSTGRWNELVNNLEDKGGFSSFLP